MDVTVGVSRELTRLSAIIRPSQVWRQLWRVVERSHVLVQVVDGRNPLLFRCADLEAYVREVNPAKECLLLVNKADFLTPHQVRMCLVAPRAVSRFHVHLTSRRFRRAIAHVAPRMGSLPHIAWPALRFLLRAPRTRAT